VGEQVNKSKRYEKQLPGWWVFTKGTWFIFFLREITCIFVALFALFYLNFARAIYAGPEAYTEFVDRLRAPGMIAIHCLSFVAVVWHTITWFVAAPKAMRPRIGNKLVPGNAIIAGHYAGWFVVSAILFWVLT